MTHEFIVLEISNNLLRKVGRALFECCYTVRLGLLQLRFDRLHVTLYPRLILHKLSNGDVAYLEIGQEALLVEPGRLKTERVDDVVDLRRTVLECLITLLGRGVGACEIAFSTLVLA